MRAREVLASAEAFAALDDDQLDLIAGLATERHHARDETLFRMEQPADRFSVVISGRIAVEVEGPAGAPLIIETIGPGQLLGVSWLLPPYRWAFSARAVEETDVVVVDADALRAHFDTDPALGYALYKLFATVIHERLVAARVRALDLYGTGTGS